MFKDRYMKIAEQITPDDSVKENIILQCKNRKISKNGYRLIPLAAAFVLAFAIPVMAYHGYVYRIMEVLYEKINPQISPIISSDTVDGVKIEINGGVCSGHVLTLYASIYDTKENRITEDFFFADPCIYIGDERIALLKGTKKHFDTQNKKGVYRLDFKLYRSLDMEEKVTLREKFLFSAPVEYKGVEIPAHSNISDENINLYRNNEFTQAGVVGYGTDEDMPNLREPKNIICVKPDNKETDLYNNIDFAYYDNTGFVNDKLHINIGFKDKTKCRTEVELYAVDSKGNRKDAVYSRLLNIADDNSDVVETTTVTQRSYEQFVFNISKEEFDDYKIYADIKYYTYQSDRPFSMSFNAKEISSSVITEENIPFGDKTIYSLEITPTCIIGKTDAIIPLYGRFIHDDGTGGKFTSGSCSSDGDFTLNPEDYMDLERLNKIILDGVTIYEK